MRGRERPWPACWSARRNMNRTSPRIRKRHKTSLAIPHSTRISRHDPGKPHLFASQGASLKFTCLCRSQKSLFTDLKFCAPLATVNKIYLLLQANTPASPATSHSTDRRVVYTPPMNPHLSMSRDKSRARRAMDIHIKYVGSRSGLRFAYARHQTTLIRRQTLAFKRQH